MLITFRVITFTKHQWQALSGSTLSTTKSINITCNRHYLNYFFDVMICRILKQIFSNFCWNFLPLACVRRHSIDQCKRPIRLFANNTKKVTRSYCAWHTVGPIAAESNRRKCCVWNSHGHVTRQSWLRQKQKFWRFGFCCTLKRFGWTIHPTTKVFEELNKKCRTS